MWTWKTKIAHTLKRWSHKINKSNKKKKHGNLERQKRHIHTEGTGKIKRSMEWIKRQATTTTINPYRVYKNSLYIYEIEGIRCVFMPNIIYYPFSCILTHYNYIRRSMFNVSFEFICISCYADLNAFRWTKKSKLSFLIHSSATKNKRAQKFDKNKLRLAWAI